MQYERCARDATSTARGDVAREGEKENTCFANQDAAHGVEAEHSV